MLAVLAGLVLLGLGAATAMGAFTAVPAGAVPEQVTASTAPAPAATNAHPAGPTDATGGEAGATAVAGMEPSLDPIRQATAAAEAGDLERARQLLEAVVADDSRSAEALTNLGIVLLRMGRASAAVAPLARAAEVSPNRADFHFNHARALGEAGDWTGAVTVYREAARLAPADFPTRFNLARALHEAGREPEALAEYEVARQLKPTDGPLHLALALTHERLNQPTEAAEAYRRYLELAPEAGDAAAVRARIERLSATPGLASATSPR